ncbi:DUF2975 domain-containing protein [Pontimicrobium sp. MEBiC01747]|jgi:hypothetical protein
MKNLKEIEVFKMIIKLMFFVFLGSYFLLIIKNVFAIMENDMSYIGVCSNQNVTSIDVGIMIVKIISKGLFFFGFYHLIKILNFKVIDGSFTNEKINLFKKSGNILLMSSIVGSIVVIFNVFKNGLDIVSNLKLNNDFLYSLYFSTIIGLFLIVFSKILERAKSLKQENELTI